MPPRSKNTGTPSSRPSRRPALTLTCSRCRARKVKCDGRTPECRICQAYGAQCHYDKLPAMSQVISMTQRIEELERLLAAENSGHSEMGDVQEMPRQTQIHRAVSSHRELASSSAVNRPSPQFESTSAVLDPANGNYDANKDATLSYTGTEELSLISETQIDFWLSNAIAAASAQLHLPLNKVEHLFKTYLTWVFPVFLFISRPHFLLGARYSSPLLISVVCLQATRFTDHALKEELHSHVRLHLSQEIFREPSIPTVQALLQLSARDLGNGSLPQAWLYSGMAFRMAMDMGIFTRPRNPRDDPTDVAVRGHLAWSCFAWDKAVSLYLGRTPSLPEPPDFDPFVPDEALEEKLWSPHLDTYSEGVTALPVRCFGVSCFVNFCKLVVIINEILVTVYGKKPDRDPTLIRQIRGKLENWWSNTPQHLRVEPTSQCPAPHVVSQNMLFHTTKILLHRPFWTNASCRTICQEAGKVVEQLLVLFETTYGLTHMTYLSAYCAYTAATVAMLDLHDQIEGSQQRVNTYLRILYGVRTSCPGIQRSIDIIIDGFSRVTPAAPSVQAPASSQPGIMQEKVEAFDMLPAFPFDTYNDFTGLNMSDNNAIPFGSLDAYALDWSMLAEQSLDPLPV